MATPCGRLSGAGKRFLRRLEGFRGQRNGYIAKLCVELYNTPGREPKLGYFCGDR
jgi:hypothetical protein